MNEHDLLKELAKIIFIYRKKRKFTLEDLHIKTEVNSKNLRAFELGKNEPQIASYFKIAKELGVPFKEIEKIISNYFRQ